MATLPRKSTLHLNPGESQVWVQFEFPQPYRAQALLLGGGNVNFFTGGTIVDGELQSSEDGANWLAIASLSASYFIKRDFPIQTYSFPPTTARYFRVVLRPAPPEAGFVAPGKRDEELLLRQRARFAWRSLELSGPRVNHWQGKAAYGDTSDFSTIATPPVGEGEVVRARRRDRSDFQNAAGWLAGMGCAGGAVGDPAPGVFAGRKEESIPPPPRPRVTKWIS